MEKIKKTYRRTSVFNTSCQGIAHCTRRSDIHTHFNTQAFEYRFVLRSSPFFGRGRMCEKLFGPISRHKPFLYKDRPANSIVRFLERETERSFATHSRTGMRDVDFIAMRFTC